jgi:L-methionine (R)-S-oxide reductase
MMPEEEKRELLEALLVRAEEIVSGPGEPSGQLLHICELLQTADLSYDWVGYYLVSRDEEEILELGPFAGEPTDHVRIPFGHGVCGQAAATGRTFIITDVSLESNYLSCSSSVKSEVVVPVYAGGKLVGELDIDSHEADGFDDVDTGFLEKLALITADAVARTGGLVH